MCPGGRSNHDGIDGALGQKVVVGGGGWHAQLTRDGRGGSRLGVKDGYELSGGAAIGQVGGVDSAHPAEPSDGQFGSRFPHNGGSFWLCPRGGQVSIRLEDCLSCVNCRSTKGAMPRPTYDAIPPHFIGNMWQAGKSVTVVARRVGPYAFTAGSSPNQQVYTMWTGCQPVPSMAGVENLRVKVLAKAGRSPRRLGYRK